MENVLIYGSIFDFTEVLTDEQTGKLFKAINTWRKDGVVEFDDLLLKGIWMGIQPNLEALKTSYGKKVTANKENGSKGGRPKKETIPQPEQKEETTKPKEEVVTNENPTKEELEHIVDENSTKLVLAQITQLKNFIATEMITTTNKLYSEIEEFRKENN